MKSLKQKCAMYLIIRPHESNMMCESTAFIHFYMLTPFSSGFSSCVGQAVFYKDDKLAISTKVFQSFQYNLTSRGKWGRSEGGWTWRGERFWCKRKLCSFLHPPSLHCNGLSWFTDTGYFFPITCWVFRLFTRTFITWWSEMKQS